jgi:5'(3')-deoxyribonucleotidase
VPSDSGKIVLGIDLDGVCADFYGRMRELASEWFECNVDDLPSEVTYGLREWGIKSSEQYASLHRFAVTQRDLFSTVPMIPGARRVLRKLSNQGYRIRIITHRLFIQYFHEIAVRQTIGWLDRHGIPYWDLSFMKEKDQVGADIYVEDSPDNLERLRRAGHFAICFGNSTNRNLGPPRANTWDEVYELIKERAPTPNPKLKRTRRKRRAA